VPACGLELTLGERILEYLKAGLDAHTFTVCPKCQIMLKLDITGLRIPAEEEKAKIAGSPEMRLVIDAQRETFRAFIAAQEARKRHVALVARHRNN